VQPNDLSEQASDSNLMAQVQHNVDDSIAPQQNEVGPQEAGLEANDVDFNPQVREAHEDLQVAEDNTSGNNQQLGMVLLPDHLDFDPGLQELELCNRIRYKSYNADGVRSWAKLFAQTGSSGMVKVPLSWFDFCTINLLHPERFDWIKKLMGSKAWNLIISESDKDESFTFSIPKNCPSSSPVKCVSNRMNDCAGNSTSELIGSSSLSTLSAELNGNPIPSVNNLASFSTPKLKRKLSKAPISVTEVRRSERVKINQQGYKAKSCKEKACLCCDVEPPTLSSKVIKCLGKEYCKVPEKLMSEEKLRKKPCAKKAAGPRVKQCMPDNKTSKDDEDTTPKKKNRRA
jgi:hypothetical protein